MALLGLGRGGKGDEWRYAVQLVFHMFQHIPYSRVGYLFFCGVDLGHGFVRVVFCNLLAVMYMKVLKVGYLSTLG